MLAGFLRGMALADPAASYTACVPFPLAPLQRRFPEIAWTPYTTESRSAAIQGCEVWLGFGGSPFQSAQSRWFIDHLVEEAALCRLWGKPMCFLGVGVQEEQELHVPEVRALCAQARAIWTRDAASSQRIRSAVPSVPCHNGVDLAHLALQATPRPQPKPGSVSLIANFDYAGWPGQADCLAAIEALGPRERWWLAQESRPLPGAEIDLHGKLAEAERARWRLHVLEEPDASIAATLQRWPATEWVVTARFHAALAALWAGSKVVVIGTNEKLRGVAADFGLPVIAPTARRDAVERALAQAKVVPHPLAEADRARAMCAEFVAAATSA